MPSAFYSETDNIYIDSIGGTQAPYDTYFFTGPLVAAEGDKVVNVGYITVFANPILANGPSLDPSCSVQGRWDWTNYEYPFVFTPYDERGKWTRPQEVYSRNRSSRDVSRKRLLLRGSGPALQLFFKDGDADTRVPWEILGWTIQETADAVA
jgi:hypothetical protein